MYKAKRPERNDRGGSPLSKRSRSSLGRYNDPDTDEEKGGRGGGGGGRSRSPISGSRGRGGGERDYYEGSRSSGAGGYGVGGYKDGGGHHAPSSSGGARPYQYKVLCISAIHARASDEIIRETLYREFKRFGDISVKVVHEPDERVAYVYFRTYEDAKEAKHLKSRIIIFDKPVMIEAAYESSSSTTTTTSNSTSNYRPQDPYGESGSRGGGGYGGSGSYSSRRSPHPQPLPASYDRGHRDDHRGGGGGGGYDRYHGGPPAHNNGPPQTHYNSMRNDDYRRGGDPRDFGGSGGSRGQQQMYPQRYDRNYDNYNSGGSTSRYPPGPPSHGGGGGPGPRGGPPMQPPQDRAAFENKKDKFPNYLHHIAPEDDPLATRTLFAGNLEVSISDEEMRRIFGRYGTVEDIDIKRPPPGTGNAFAFVRFANLDMAARAKTELSGQYIGKFQCKIGYGKVNPTTKIWVGGLGPWATLPQIEREFDRFGSIKKIDWDKGDEQCFITYETIDAAQAAVKDMRGYALGGNDKRIRTDFAGVEQIVGYAGKYENEKGYDYGNSGGGGGGGGGSGSSGSRNRRGTSSNVVLTGGSDPDAPAHNYSPRSNNTDNADSPSDSESTTKVERRKSDGGRNGTAATPTVPSSASALLSAKSVLDIAQRDAVGWQGTLILKNSSFPTKLYLTDGDLQNVNVLLKDEEGKDKLRITQRLRLDQAKLDDVTKRMEVSSGYSVFLGWPAVSPSSPLSSPNNGSESPIQTRSLKYLVSYLKTKEAAGVITLANKAMDLTGVLYVFPPGPFSLELLQKTCPELEDSTEDYLVMVVIRGGTA